MQQNESTKPKQLIKNRIRNISQEEEIIYSTDGLDYIVTLNSNDGLAYCYGNQRLDLTHFIIPGITSKLSAESGEFLKTSEIFKNIVDLFSIEESEIYFILRVVDNSKISGDAGKETVFIFSDKRDCLYFNSVLLDLSLRYKTDYLKLTCE